MRTSADRLAIAGLGSFCLMTLALRWYQQPVYPWELRACLVALMLLLIGWLIAKQRGFWLLCMLCVLGITGALTRTRAVYHVPSPATADFYADQDIALTGQIVRQPERSPVTMRYMVAVRSLSGVTLPVTGHVLLRTRQTWPRYHYGDCLAVTGRLEVPSGDEDFRYDLYLAVSNIFSVMQEAHLTPVPCERTLLTNVQRGLIAFKEAFEGTINRLVPEPTAALLAGILTGTRRSIAEEILEDFKVTGLSHVIAISGFNITIIVAVIGQMLFFLPLRYRLIPSVTAIVLFTIFVGASAAVVRAAIMGCLGVFALHVGRKSQARLTLLWTLALMTAWNPRSLWYDAGLQLSFLAVLGLMEIGPRLQPLFRFFPEALGIRESLQMTTAAQIATAPLLAGIFGRVSLIAPLANLLIAPTIPLAMLLGFLSVCFGAVYEPIGLLIAYPTWALLTWVIWVAGILSRVPYASVTLF